MVLIIEDDPAVREMLEILFEGEGHRTTAVSGTSEAYRSGGAWGDCCRTSSWRDYNLPGELTGTEIIARLRDIAASRHSGHHPHRGHIERYLARRSADADCVHLSKPAKAEILAQHVQASSPRSGCRSRAKLRRPTLAAAGEPQPTIFLVDDDRTLRDDMQELLKGHGRRAEVYASGDAFLEAGGQDRTGCLVVDALMPGMGGIALLERLKAENRSLPSIMVTGHGDIPMAVQAMKAGAADFLEKPVRLDKLVASIDRALERAGDSVKLSSGARRRPSGWLA